MSVFKARSKLIISYTNVQIGHEIYVLTSFLMHVFVFWQHQYWYFISECIVYVKESALLSTCMRTIVLFC